jgi:hypothetical protein
LEATAGMIAEAIAEELVREHQQTAVTLPNWDDCTEQLLGIYNTVLNCKSDLPIGSHVIA